MTIEDQIANAIERAFEAGYCKGVDDTLRLSDTELRELVAEACRPVLAVVK